MDYLGSIFWGSPIFVNPHMKTAPSQDPPELIEPNKIMVFEGLHPIYDEKAAWFRVEGLGFRVYRV